MNFELYALKQHEVYRNKLRIGRTYIQLAGSTIYPVCDLWYKSISLKITFWPKKMVEVAVLCGNAMML